MGDVTEGPRTDCLHDPYEDQLNAARYKAERDQLRQELQGLREWTEDLEWSCLDYFGHLEEAEAKAKRLGRLVWRLQNRLARAHRRERNLRKGMRMWREKVIGAPVRTVSAYDLLSEEDLQALRWVREQGGMEAVEKRLVPEGYEWPRFEDGELITTESMLFDSATGNPYRAEIIIFNELDDAEIRVHVGGASYAMGERVKRPAAQAGDGEPLEVGQTVWLLDDGGRAKCECEVIDVCESVGKFSVMVREVGKYGYSYVRPSSLTHTKPEPQEKTCEDCAHFAKDPNTLTMGVCFAKTFDTGDSFSYEFTYRNTLACEKYKERGE